MIDDKTNEQSLVAKPFERWGAIATMLWSFFLLFVVSGLVSLVGVLLYTHYGLTTQEAIDKLSKNGDSIAQYTLINNTILIGSLWVLVKLKQKDPWLDYLPMKAVPIWTLFKWTIAAWLLMEALGYFFDALGMSHSTFADDILNSSQNKVLLGLALVVAAPVMEELLFRGFMISGLERLPIADASSVAIALTAFLWGIIHLQYAAHEMFSIFLSGVLFGFARRQTGSLLTPLIMHMTLNSWALAATMLLKN